MKSTSQQDTEIRYHLTVSLPNLIGLLDSFDLQKNDVYVSLTADSSNPKTTKQRTQQWFNYRKGQSFQKQHRSSRNQISIHRRKATTIQKCLCQPHSTTNARNVLYKHRVVPLCHMDCCRLQHTYVYLVKEMINT